MEPNETASGLDMRVVLGAAVSLVILGVIAYFLYSLTPQSPEIQTQTPVLDTSPDIGAQVSGAVESPAEKLPQTNPFEGYKNPFE